MKNYLKFLNLNDIELIKGLPERENKFSIPIDMYDKDTIQSLIRNLAFSDIELKIIENRTFSYFDGEKDKDMTVTDFKIKVGNSWILNKLSVFLKKLKNKNYYNYDSLSYRK